MKLRGRDLDSSQKKPLHRQKVRGVLRDKTKLSIFGRVWKYMWNVASEKKDIQIAWQSKYYRQNGQSKYYDLDMLSDLVFSLQDIKHTNIDKMYINIILQPNIPPSITDIFQIPCCHFFSRRIQLLVTPLWYANRKSHTEIEMVIYGPEINYI